MVSYQDTRRRLIQFKACKGDRGRESVAIHDDRTMNLGSHATLFFRLYSGSVNYQI